MPVPALRRTSWAWASGLTVTLAATALLLGGVVAVGPWDGVFLFRDFVTVPDPVLGANTGGGDAAPRAVPLDVVVAALSTLLPSGLVARVLLVSPLLLVGTGMTALLRRHGPVATAVGAALAITNPYVAERLLLGQAPSLLGFAMIPWVVLAVRAGRPLRVRLLLVLLAAAPAAITPVGTVMAGVTVLVVALALPPRQSTTGPTVQVHAPAAPRGRVTGPTVQVHSRAGRWASRVGQAVALVVPVGLLSLPWLLPALAHPTAGAVRDGADAFAVAADGPWGTIGSVVTLGGVWAGGAWPDSRANAAVLAAQLVLVLGAVSAWWWLRRTEHTSHRPGRSSPLDTRLAALGPDRPTRSALDLAAAAYVAGVVGVLLLAGPLLPLWRELQQVPGLALARDTHRWLGWSALAVAALVALGLAHLVELSAARTVPVPTPAPGPGATPAVTAAAAASQAPSETRTKMRAGPAKPAPKWVGVWGGCAVVLALGILTVPDVPARLAQDARPVAVPAEWTTVVDLVNEGPEGAVLLLPWQPFRQLDRVGPVQFLDPFPRALEAEAIHSRTLTVRRDGAVWEVGGEEDPQVRALATGPSLEAEAMREAGISQVIIWRQTPGASPTPGQGLSVVHDGSDWQVLRVGQSP